MRSGFTARLCTALFALAALTITANASAGRPASDVEQPPRSTAVRTIQPHTAPGEADAHLRDVVGAQEHLAAVAQWLATVTATAHRSPTPATAPASAASRCTPGRRPTETPPLVADAFVDLDMFWCEQFSRRSLRYRPIAHVYAYHGHHGASPACGISEGSGNAFYCSRDLSVSYDVDWFAEGVSPVDPGNLDEAVVVLAHEFGHHVQQLLGTAGRLSSQTELQADCYAGVYLNAVARGSRPVHMTNPSVASVLTMFIVADGASHFNGSHWSDPGAHGDALTRRYAWGRGFATGDLEQCAGFAHYAYQPPIVLGDNRLVVPPGANVRRTRANALFSTGRTTVTVTALSARRGPTAERFAAAAVKAKHRPTGWKLRWNGPLQSFRLGRAQVALRDYTETRLCGAGSRHGTMLLGIGGDGVALLLDGSRPGAPSDASRDSVDTTLIAAVNGSSTLLG